MKRFFVSLGLFAVAACGSSADDGPLAVAVIGTQASLFDSGVRLSPAAQHLRAATTEGLVALDPSGRVIPALAERWIVTDDGLSYIFRLRQSDWSNGEEMTAESVRASLREAIARLDDTSLGLDLGKVAEVRAMTGRVVEIRLTSPMPQFLQLLAQPEMGLIREGVGAGPMVMSRNDGEPTATLTAKPREARGLPPLGREDEDLQRITVRAMPANQAIDAFTDGKIDLVLNGRLSSFPQVELGPLSRGTIQLDPAQGLFGLAFKNSKGLLADPARREALSMAINRTELLQRFALDGWQPNTWIAPAQFFDQVEVDENRWSGLSIEDRINIARRRIAQWRAEPGRDATIEGPARISVAMPSGPGSDLLFEQLVSNWRAIGVSAYRAEAGETADLELVDRLARYSSPRWFLNQFHCSLRRGLCSPDADEIIEDSLGVRDLVEKEQLLAEAQATMIADEVFIPLGAPIRWSLVRGAVSAYAPNPWGLHPLFPLSQPPI